MKKKKEREITSILFNSVCFYALTQCHPVALQTRIEETRIEHPREDKKIGHDGGGGGHPIPKRKKKKLSTTPTTTTSTPKTKSRTRLRTSRNTTLLYIHDLHIIATIMVFVHVCVRLHDRR